MTNIISQTVSTIKNWWLFLLTGVLSIIVSIWVFFTPVESYAALAWVFSILVFAHGISSVFFSISNRKQLEGWGWYLTGGIFEFFMGIILIAYPGISLVLLPLFVGFWFMFRGVQVISASIEMKKYGYLDWGWILVFGILLTVISFFMILDPIFGFLNVVYLSSFALLIYGIANIMFSIQLKKIKSKTIDKVADFKKDIKKGIKELKEEILKNMEEPSTEQIQNIDRAFDEYNAHNK